MLMPVNVLADYTESLNVLNELQLLRDVVNTAKQAEHVTIGIKTKFDSISSSAYSKDIDDDTLQSFQKMAPTDMNTKQRVRFMEVLAASMPEGQVEGRASPAPSQVKTQSQYSPAASQVMTQSQFGSLAPSQVVTQSQSSPALSQVQTQSQSTCDSEDLNGQGRVIWTHEAILLLIEKRRELGHLFDNNAVTQRQAWRKVAEELRSKGYKYGEDDCSKKFRSLRARYKTVKQRNRQTGNSRQSWRYYDVMEDMFAGDPAVIPTNVASSMRVEPPVPSVDISQITEDQEPSDEQPLTSTPRVQRKRRRSSIDTEEPPQWFEKYQMDQQKMHEERMGLERRRVGALETLVKLLQEKQ
ncbi:uncharacterized protein LOC128553629 [Mercenaria mercenaria]|uniref:uncharacterized protein LOC128553629 n=1 Tax=Mercenaria mercenaria TaxID=6596 RepID=UPI00234ED72A|nr:uncharacterized protein LOC128553629 [Mercenaria mercenaria]